MTTIGARAVRDERLLRHCSQPAFVAFDVNGTLIDTMKVLLEVAFDLTGPRTLTLSSAELIRQCGGNLETTLRCIAAIVQRDVDEIVEALLVRCVDHPPLYPAVREVLLAIRVPFGIVTNASLSFTKFLLKAAKLDSYFDEHLIVANARKPSPEGLRTLLNVVGCRPEDAWLVGDSYNDITAARRAGVTAVGVMYGYGLVGNEHGVQIWLRSFHEVGELLHCSAA